MPRKKKLKVALVSTWPPRWCGIATYSEKLLRALRGAGTEVHVVCHTDGGRPGEEGVHPVIDQADPAWHLNLYWAVEAIDPDVVHIQHEFGIFSLMDRPGIYNFEPSNAFELAVPLFKWKVKGRPAVITYHSVFSRLTREEALYYDHLVSLAAANIVHEPYQRENLPYNLGRVPGNVFTCPHGADYGGLSRAEIAAVRKELGVNGRPVAGVMGWWEPNKGFERLVRLWPRVKEQVPEAMLVVAGDARPGSPTGEPYKASLLKDIEASPARDSIRVVTGAFSSRRFLEVISAYDVMVLPYLFASQSGNLAHAYQAGLPVIVSALEGLKSSVEASRAGIIVEDDEELLRATVTLLRDPSLRRQYAARSRRYVKKVVDWRTVARNHLNIYRWAIRHLKEERAGDRHLAERVHV